MKKSLLSLALAAAVVSPTIVPTVAVAQRYDRHWHGDQDGNWDPANSYRGDSYRSRELSENDRVYRGSDGRYYCKRSNGTTGLVLGAVGGGVIGNVLGGGTLGTLLGAGGGALLGKTLDQNHDRDQNRRNGYRCG